MPHGAEQDTSGHNPLAPICCVGLALDRTKNAHIPSSAQRQVRLDFSSGSRSYDEKLRSLGLWQLSQNAVFALHSAW